MIKKKKYIISVLTLAIIFLITTIIIQNINKENSEIVYSINNEENNIELYLKNMSTGEKELFKTLYDAYINHYHCFEAYKNNFYVIKEVKPDDETYIYELWKYDKHKKGTKIYSDEGLDFRVSPNQKYIAINDSSNGLIFIDTEGNILKKYTPNQLKIHDEYEFNIGLLEWADNSESFLGSIFMTINTYSLYKINMNSYEIEKFDISHLPMEFDYALNPNNEILVYSDYPTTFCSDDYNNLKNSNQKITLFLYDLRNKNIKEVATSIAKEFSPIWINNNTIEFENPKGEKRTIYTLTP